MNWLGIGSSALLLLFVLGAVAEQDEDDLSTEVELDSVEGLEELREIVEKLSEKNDNVTEVETANGWCRCCRRKCTCCHYIHVGRLRLKGTFCFSVRFRSCGRARVRLTFGPSVVTTRVVAGCNPPRICGRTRYMRRGASICVRLYNMRYRRRCYGGCAIFVARSCGIPIQRIHLGCFGGHWAEGAIHHPYLSGPKDVEKNAINAIPVEEEDQVPSDEWMTLDDSEDADNNIEYEEAIPVEQAEQQESDYWYKK